MNVENREISTKILDSIEELRKSINVISVYDFNIYSSMELYYTIANKLNEVVTECNRYEIAISEEIINQNNCLQYLLNGGLNSEVANKINNLIKDGTIGNLINDNLLGTINARLDKMATKSELQVQANRIDNLSKISQGSTTGDAELIDGRLGGDGVLDTNIGNSIKRQYKKNKEAIDDIKEELKNLYSYNKQYLDNNGFTPNTYYSNNKLELSSASGYNTQCVTNLPAGTYYYSHIAAPFTWFVNRETGEVKRASTDYNINDSNGGNGSITINYDYDLYYTTSGSVDHDRCWQNFPFNINTIKQDFTYGISNLKLVLNDEIDIIIGTSSNAQYTTISEAINYINSLSSNKIYNLLIEDGTYEENNLDLPNNVNLIGKSKIKEKVIIKGELPSNASDSDITNKSTINLKYSNRLENITITAKNLRYAVHSESNGNITNWSQIVKNCHIEHFGNNSAVEYRQSNGLNSSSVWKQCYAWGEGVSSGAYAYFENTKFKSATSQSWYIHEAVSMGLPYYHKFKNCIFESNGAYSLQISEVRNSTQINTVEIESCQIFGKGIYIQGTYPINIMINDCGDVPFMIETNKFDYNHFPQFKGRINRLKYVGSTTINGGELLRYDTNANQVTTVDSNTDINLIIGYAISNVDKEGYVYICTSPYYPNSTGYDGNYVGISSSSKPVNYSSGTKIGVSLSSTIKLFLP